ncbi:MAG: hypothetical protein JKX80_02465 [Candidatus Pacebacteria bacterium]|nr:hypothetical protein [Candidatus Paceibacterota bacterium]
MEKFENTPHLSEKEITWKNKMAELDAYGSNEGDDIPIDEGIKESIAALNLLGIPTTSSCSGRPEDHDRSGGFPTLQGVLEDDPKGNDSARESVQQLLAEFNGEHSTKLPLQLNPYVTDGYRIESPASITGEDGNYIGIESVDGYNQEEMAQEARKEFDKFTEFLKRKISSD